MLPELSRATPAGTLNSAALPAPSARPAAVPPELLPPASVVTVKGTTTGEDDGERVVETLTDADTLGDGATEALDDADGVSVGQMARMTFVLWSAT